LTIASASTSEPNKVLDMGNGNTLTVAYGDFSEQMTKITNEMKQAMVYAANEHQLKMCKSYVDSFRKLIRT
jgi:hypothetical protein